MKISVDRLKSRRACEDQVRLFRKLFGDGEVKVTLDACRQAVKAGLNVGWAAYVLLGEDARAFYNRQMPVSFEAYTKDIALARQTYDAAGGEAAAIARQTYDKATVAARDAHDEAVAKAFFKASKLV